MCFNSLSILYFSTSNSQGYIKKALAQPAVEQQLVNQEQQNEQQQIQINNLESGH